MNVRTIILPTLGLAGALLMPLAAQAQTVPAPPTSPRHTLNQRFRDQHARIKAGVASGQLTRREARADRFRLNHVRYQDQRDRFFQGGHLTAAERRHQNMELNRNSGDIYRTKHNGQVR